MPALVELPVKKSNNLLVASGMHRQEIRKDFLSFSSSESFCKRLFLD